MESLDGRTLWVSDGRSLWRQPTEGGKRELVIERFPTSMDWEIVSSGIYFKNRFDSSSIDFYDFESQSIRTVIEFSKPGYTGLSASPDGQHVLFVQGEPPESDLMLVESFR